MKSTAWEGVKNMSNSPLVTYKHICKHYDKGRQGKKIDKIFVHHMAGNLTVKQCGNVFDNRQASAHYGVNGAEIGLYVNESDTAWHSGVWSYNLRSIGIELANNSGSPKWTVADLTIDTAIKLIADICRRNGIAKLNYTGDVSGNLCMHKWVASTSCPGPYLSTKFSYIANQVNILLGKEFPSKYGEL
jgi:N-acetyl-anhydromuramyl-L-alanine amidase AmpD